MKKKITIINLSLMLSILFAILLQSVHSYECILHQETSFAKHSDDKSTKIQVLDHDHEKCFVCQFTLSNFIPTEFTNFTSFITFNSYSNVSFPHSQTAEIFSGSIFTHRGPPSIC